MKTILMYCNLHENTFSSEQQFPVKALHAFVQLYFWFFLSYKKNAIFRLNGKTYLTESDLLTIVPQLVRMNNFREFLQPSPLSSEKR